MKQRKEERAVSAAPEGKMPIRSFWFGDGVYELPKPIYVTIGLSGAELEREVLKEVVKQLAERGAENE